MGVTQKDVAERAGVSRSVVSHVMHGGAGTIRVRPETAEHVRRVALEMGYQPNAFARNFRRQKTGVIGVLHGDGLARLRFSTIDGYFSTLMDGIVDGAFAHGYTVGMCPDLFGPTPEKAMADGRFDGFIWYSTRLTPEIEERIRDCRVPMVFLHVESKRFNDRYPTVICDNKAGVRLAVEHLAGLGHRRIGFLADADHRSVESRMRAEILMAECMRYGIEVALIDWAPNKSALTAYFQSCVRETAIVAHSDQYAIDAIRVAERSGLRVPEDLSVVGFDSTAFCETHSPKLTSISQPLEAMGERAVDLLVAMLENRFAGPMETVLPCGFDVRESTGPAASRR